MSYQLKVDGKLSINGREIRGSHSPTETFKDDVVTEIGSSTRTSIVKTINRMKIYDDTGTLQEDLPISKIFDNTSESPPNVIFRVSYTATKTYNIARIDLIARVDTTDYIYFSYTLDTPVSVDVDYGVRIDYKKTITMTALTANTSIDTSYTRINYYLLKILIGSRTIGGIEYYLNFDHLEIWSDTTKVGDITEESRTYDTTNNYAEWKGKITPTSDISYNKVVMFCHAWDTSIDEPSPYHGVALSLTSPDTLYADVTYTFYFRIKI